MCVHRYCVCVFVLYLSVCASTVCLGVCVCVCVEVSTACVCVPVHYVCDGTIVCVHQYCVCRCVCVCVVSSGYDKRVRDHISGSSCHCPQCPIKKREKKSKKPRLRMIDHTDPHACNMYVTCQCVSSANTSTDTYVDPRGVPTENLPENLRTQHSLQH